ncbi:MAG: HEAT repeat domain-containing protein, partial [Sandaracinaceae bacterium]|nr:HEAT repeat domain-containing protein [Sandaracinaceae bacterium]
AIEPLAALVRDDDVMTASCAVEALASVARRGVDSHAVAALLVETLTRTEPVLRLAALDGLIAIAADVEAAVLGPLLEDSLTRASAVRLLARARSAATHDGLDEVSLLLLRALTHPRSTVEAALALARRSDPELPDARRALTDPRARAALANALAGLEGARIADLAEALETRPLPDARALARLSLEGREPRLLLAIVELGARAELDPPCREALVAWGGAVVPALVEIVRLRATDDVRAAAWALEAASDLSGLSATDDAIADELRALARGLLSQGEEVGALAAASSLGRWGDAEDARALAARVGAHGSAYEAAAAAAVEQIASRTSSEVRAAMPERVGKRSVSSPALTAVSTLRQQLGSDDAEIRAGALDALTTVSSEELELVALCLTDEDERVEVAALRALSHVRDPEVLEAATAAVRVALLSELPTVRAEALRTLAELGAFEDEALRNELRVLLADESPRVVIAALRALGASHADDPRLEPAIEAAVAHADAEVVKEALLATQRPADVVARAARALGHEHWSVRARAAEVLGRVLALAAADPALSAVAREALSRRAPEEPDELVQRAIASSLAEVG